MVGKLLKERAPAATVSFLSLACCSKGELPLPAKLFCTSADGGLMAEFVWSRLHPRQDAHERERQPPLPHHASVYAMMNSGTYFLVEFEGHETATPVPGWYSALS